MRKADKITAAFAACAALGALAMPISRADDAEDQMVALAINAGIDSDSGTILKNAHGVCNAIDNGVTPRQATLALIGANHQMAGHPDIAMKFVASAVVTICPQFKTVGWDQSLGPNYAKQHV